MITVLRRWLGWALGVAALASAGCGEPPPMVSMAPPGSGVDPLAIDVNDDNFKAKALGETAPSREASPNADAGLDESAPLREPTEVGEEVVLDSGLKYSTIKAGDPEGDVARLNTSVRVFYKGTFEDGKEFESNFGEQPTEFRLVPGQMIRGWTEGIPGMRVGETRKLYVPSELGYGTTGSPGKIPPNTPLVFEVELLGVN